MSDYSNYLYFKGEKDCPIYEWENSGKIAWWGIEASAYRNGDKKEKGKLSQTMLDYIREWHWEPDRNISWEEAVKRANEIYNRGVFNTDYFYNKSKEAVDEIVRNETKADYQFPPHNMV
ncbi:MAG: hypothetical protein LBT29_05760 [Flavobacteriaceae bacterium]|jgi:hypothetical protein|nr:hypothetical protein [Flavobacteriaceae bacterium]